MISSCGHDERNQYHGGAAGDQSGTEWYIRTWYKGGWDEVLIHPDAAVREAIAKNAERGAANPNIGYDQYQRLTFFNALKSAKWDASKIAVKCEADCSSSTAACVIAAGHLAAAPKLRDVSPSLTTWYIGAALKAVGFARLTDAKYLTSDVYLPRGAIINRSNQHVVINITDGARASETVKYIGGYDSKEDEVNDSDIKKIVSGVTASVPKATWDYDRKGTELEAVYKESTRTDDPTGRKVKMTDHAHIKWIGKAQTETKEEVEKLTTKVDNLEKKLDWIIEKIGE